LHQQSNLELLHVHDLFCQAASEAARRLLGRSWSSQPRRATIRRRPASKDQPGLAKPHMDIGPGLASLSWAADLSEDVQIATVVHDRNFSFLPTLFFFLSFYTISISNVLHIDTDDAFVPLAAGR
jgi:hypothetical protein